MEGNTAKSDRHFIYTQKKLAHLEEVRIMVSSAPNAAYEDFNGENSLKTFKSPKLTKFTLVLGVESEW